MLKLIYIDNYALIERLEIEFREGLTIITGETGAGKTILLGALGLLLGKRADNSILKDKERKCVVEGLFNLEGYQLENFFRDNELDFNRDTIIRREVSNNGKSRAFINNTPVTLDIVQELSLSLIDIHSQHQNLSLNSDSYMLWIADTYAGTTHAVKKYSQVYAEWKELARKYNNARETYLKDKQNLDYLLYQYNELHAANLKEGEYQQLEERYSMLSNAGEIKSALESISELLENEETGAIVELRKSMELIAHISRHIPKATELKNRIEANYIELKDIQSEAANLYNDIEFDPGEADRLNQRLETINGLLFKHKVTSVEELISIKNVMDNKLKDLSFGVDDLEKMARNIKEKEDQIMKLAGTLSSSRKAKFSEFQDKISRVIHQLGMKNAEFFVACETIQPNETGIDKIQFKFSANRNMPAQNLSKVASGGELSRLMLAIKHLISGASGLPTIIFDEINSGVSGEIADKVGRLIREMATGMQVINITHLPQVASKGNHHFLVYKKTVEGTTRTMVKLLNREERLNEVARMLSGDSITEAALENARVLMQEE